MRLDLRTDVLRSLVTGAVLGALALSGVSMPAAADDLQTVGPADPNALTTFSVYLPPDS